MRIRKAVIYGGAALALIIVAAAAGLYFFADRIANSGRVRTAVLSALSEAVSGTAAYEKLDVGFFPAPHLTVSRLKITRPDTGAAVEMLELYPRLAGLLSGDFQLRSALVKDLNMNLVLPAPEETPFDPAEVEKKLIPVFQALYDYAPGLHLSVRNGALKLSRAGADKEGPLDFGPLDFRKIDLDLKLSKALDLDLRCGSSPWGALALAGRFTRGDGWLEAERLRASAGRSSLAEAWGRFDWTEPHRAPRLQARLKGGEFALGELSAWNFGPRSGDLLKHFAPDVKKIGGTVHLASADFEGPLGTRSEGQTKSGAKPGGGPKAGGGGQAESKAEPEAEPKAEMNWRYSAAGSLENTVIEIRQWEPPIRVPAAAFQLAQDSLSFQKADLETLDTSLRASGVVRMSDWTVEASHVAGKIGRRTVQDVTARVPALRDRLIPAEISLEGAFSYHPEAVEIQKLSLSTGGASVTKLSGQMELEGKHRLKAEAERLVISPREFGARGLKLLQRALPDLKSIQGTFTFSSVRFEGALKEAGNWHYSASGAVRNGVVEVAFLPGALRIPAASFTADQDRLVIQNARAALLDSQIDASGQVRMEKGKMGPAEVQFAGRVGEASLKWASGRFAFPPEVLLAEPFTVKGGRLSWNTPESFSLGGALNLGPSAGTTGRTAGLETEPQPLQLSFELERAPGALRIPKASVKDHLSDATVSLDYGKDRVAAFSFAGSLSKRTLDRLYRIDQPEGARIAGNLTGRLPLSTPRRSSARGNLNVADLRVPLGERGPLLVESAEVKADGNRFNVLSSRLGWQNHAFGVQGQIRLPASAAPGRERIAVNADVRAATIDVDALTRALTRPEQPETKPPGKTAGQPFGWVDNLPVEGEVRIKADRLTRKGLTIEPLAADVSLGRGRVRIFVTKALLCGLPVPGAVEIKPAGLTFTTRSEVQNTQIATILKCLAGERMGLTGFATFRTELEGTDQISKSLWGDGDLLIRNGRIYRAQLLSRILQFLNITQIVLGDVPDFSKKGMAYDVIRVRYRLEGNKVILKRIILRGPTLGIAGDGSIDLAKNTMNLTLLVSPLRTVDKILARIPLVRNFRGLLGVPVSVYGNVNNPIIVPLSPTAVGSHIFDLMKEAIELPFDLFQPFTR